MERFITKEITMGKKLREGMSIIELILVLCLIGILCMLIFPRVDEVADNAKVKQLSDQVVDDLRLLQSEAMINDCNSFMKIYHYSKQYELFLEKNGQKKLIKQVKLSNEAYITSSAPGNIPIIYNSNGTAPNVYQTIEVRQHGDLKEKIIPYHTGRIRTE